MVNQRGGVDLGMLVKSVGIFVGDTASVLKVTKSKCKSKNFA